LYGTFKKYQHTATTDDLVASKYSAVQPTMVTHTDL